MVVVVVTEGKDLEGRLRGVARIWQGADERGKVKVLRGSWSGSDQKDEKSWSWWGI